MKPLAKATVVHSRSFSSSLCSSSFPFQSSEFGSSSISKRQLRWCEMMIELEP